MAFSREFRGHEGVDWLFSMTAQPRIALVHDALINTGGAERVLTFMHEAFPDAPIFTSVYRPDHTFNAFKSARVIPLAGSRLARDERSAKSLLPLWLLGFSRLNLSRFDIIVTSSTWGAKFVRPPRGARHICYCYAPFRWLWAPQSYSPESLPIVGWGRHLAALAAGPLRRLDYAVTRAIPRLATTCANMARSIAAHYGREARVIYAPVRVADYAVQTATDDYYLAVSRLMSHKRLDLAVRACRQLGRRLIVVGEGPERTVLEALGGPETHFTGRVSELSLRRLYAGCRAVLYPSHEDYGLVPLEAQAAGRPVIAFGAGGAVETIATGLTGVFFQEQVVESVVAAIRVFEASSFDSAAIREWAWRFDVAPFVRALRGYALAGDESDLIFAKGA
jgi:glycosyltransferase involved in cell wall biosynthesis